VSRVNQFHAPIVVSWRLKESLGGLTAEGKIVPKLRSLQKGKGGKDIKKSQECNFTQGERDRKDVDGVEQEKCALHSSEDAGVRSGFGKFHLPLFSSIACPSFL
jgi:hypothetical protein